MLSSFRFIFIGLCWSTWSKLCKHVTWFIDPQRDVSHVSAVEPPPLHPPTAKELDVSQTETQASSVPSRREIVTASQPSGSTEPSSSVLSHNAPSQTSYRLGHDVSVFWIVALSFNVFWSVKLCVGILIPCKICADERKKQYYLLISYKTCDYYVDEVLNQPDSANCKMIVVKSQLLPSPLPKSKPSQICIMFKM